MVIEAQASTRERVMAFPIVSVTYPISGNVRDDKQIRNFIFKPRLKPQLFRYLILRMLYAWDELNIDHISRHRVTPVEAEYVVDHAKSPEEIEFESLSIDDWADLGEMDRII